MLLVNYFIANPNDKLSYKKNLYSKEGTLSISSILDHFQRFPLFYAISISHMLIVT